MAAIATVVANVDAIMFIAIMFIIYVCCCHHDADNDSFSTQNLSLSLSRSQGACEGDLLVLARANAHALEPARAIV